MHLTYRKTCRICGSLALTKVIDLGMQHLQGSFIKSDEPLPPLRKISTVLVRCDPTLDENACGLLQTQISVPPDILYDSYWYESGTNQTMREHLKSIAEEAVALLGKKKIFALDIGCNEGFFSLRLADKGAYVLGGDIDEFRIKKARFVQSVVNKADLEFKV